MPDLAPRLEVLLARESIAVRVNALAERVAPDLGDDTVAICLLTGGLWFAADLTRALAGLGTTASVRVSQTFHSPGRSPCRTS